MDFVVAGRAPLEVGDGRDPLERRTKSPSTERDRPGKANGFVTTE
jgi:hypothetical protein